MITPYDSPRYPEAWATISTMVAILIARGIPETVIMCTLLEVTAALGDSTTMPQSVRDQVAQVAYHAADLIAAPVTAKEA